jgi:hypothetical protein
MTDQEHASFTHGYNIGKAEARQKILEALLRLQEGHREMKWSIEFVLKFLSLDPEFPKAVAHTDEGKGL